MSAIPPPGHASLIQTTGAAQRAAEQRKTEAADAGKTDAFADRLKMAVENDDRDSAVYEDAEGAGGQGRQGHAEHEEHPPEATPPEPDETPSDGIDLSA